MKKFNNTVIFIFLIFASVNISQAQDVTNLLKSATLKCNVKFKNTKFNNPHAGSGFLVETTNGIFGCTAKHVIYFAKSEKMNSVSFQGTLESWNFVSGEDQTKFISSINLLNEDPNEKLGGMFKNDWLVFKINQETPTLIKTLKLRETKLKEGEKVYFSGYPYKKDGMVQIEGTFKNYKENSMVVEVPPAHYNGCSGGPVVDEKGLLVGIVSMGFFNEKTGVMTFEPATTEYLNKILNNS